MAATQVDNCYYRGLLRMLAIYSGTSPLHDLHNDENPHDVGGYLAFWRFMESAGSSVADASGSGHSLSIAGASWDFGADGRPTFAEAGGASRIPGEPAPPER